MRGLLLTASFRSCRRMVRRHAHAPHQAQVSGAAHGTGPGLRVCLSDICNACAGPCKLMTYKIRDAAQAYGNKGARITRNRCADCVCELCRNALRIVWGKRLSIRAARTAVIVAEHAPSFAPAVQALPFHCPCT